MPRSRKSVAKIAIDAAGAAGLLYAVPVTVANPRGITVHHRGPGAHIDCPANLIVACVACHGVAVYCWLPEAEIRADRREQWRCEPCLSAGAL